MGCRRRLARRPRVHGWRRRCALCLCGFLCIITANGTFFSAQVEPVPERHDGHRLTHCKPNRFAEDATSRCSRGALAASESRSSLESNQCTAGRGCGELRSLREDSMAVRARRGIDPSFSGKLHHTERLNTLLHEFRQLGKAHRRHGALVVVGADATTDSEHGCVSRHHVSK